MRTRLVQAAIDLVRTRGLHTVSTASLAKRVGISQSGFYQHFWNIDECLAAAALVFAEEMRSELRAMREQFFASIVDIDDPRLPELLRESYERSLSQIVDNPRYVALMIMFRRFVTERSKFSEELQRVNDQVVAELAEETFALGKPRGLTENDRAEVEINARLGLAIWEGAIDLLIRKPKTDRKKVVEVLARTQLAIINASLPPRAPAPVARAKRAR